MSVLAIAAVVVVVLPVVVDQRAGAQAVGSSIEQISVGNNGEQLSEIGGTEFAGISADGDVVVFSSTTGDLVAGDTNDRRDGFLRSRSGQSTRRVTVGSDGSQLSDGRVGAMSHNGRFVVFVSSDSTIVEGDTNGESDVFLKDLETGVVERVNVSTSGEQANGFSNGTHGVSDDGNIVAFSSSATNLVARDTNGSTRDVFVRDRAAGVTKRVRVRGEPSFWFTAGADLTPDGRYLAFNAWFYVYRYEVATGETELVSLDPTGEFDRSEGSQASISADGRYVAYAPSRGGIVVRDMESAEPGQIVTVNAAGVLRGGRANRHSLSDDGRYVAFVSSATDLAQMLPEGTPAQAYVFDRDTEMTRLVSVNNQGEPANSRVERAGLSSDGSTAVFSTRADNLVPGDTNDQQDVFAVDLVAMEVGCNGHPVTIFGSGEINGTNGDDVIQGSAGADVINAGGGNDIICGLDGDDIIDGGDGDDQIFGDDGDDQVTAGAGKDRVFAGKGNDRVLGGDDADMIYGGPGTDFVKGDTGADTLGGGPGDDKVIGGPGQDSLGGGEGNDLCRGSAGKDRYFLCENKQP